MGAVGAGTAEGAILLADGASPSAELGLEFNLLLPAPTFTPGFAFRCVFGVVVAASFAFETAIAFAVAAAVKAAALAIPAVVPVAFLDLLAVPAVPPD